MFIIYNNNNNMRRYKIVWESRIFNIYYARVHNIGFISDGQKQKQTHNFDELENRTKYLKCFFTKEIKHEILMWL